MEQTITKSGSSLQDRLAQELSDELERIAQGVAADQGNALGTSRVSHADLLRLWGRKDPLANYDQIVQQLQTTGVPQPMLSVPQGASASNSQRQWLIIAQEQPDLIPQYTAPTQDGELAKRLAIIAEYPFRMGVLQDIDDPDEQVALANRLDKEWMASQTTMQSPEEATPAPAQVEPQQPSAPPSTPMPDPMMPQGAAMQQAVPQPQAPMGGPT